MYFFTLPKSSCVTALFSHLNNAGTPLPRQFQVKRQPIAAHNGQLRGCLLPINTYMHEQEKKGGTKREKGTEHLEIEDRKISRIGGDLQRFLANKNEQNKRQNHAIVPISHDHLCSPSLSVYRCSLSKTNLAEPPLSPPVTVA